jgi:para-aminobenzoate synthetase component 1
VNLVGHASAPYRGDPTAALRRVTRLPGARYGQMITGAGWAVASATPELLVRIAPTVIGPAAADPAVAGPGVAGPGVVGPGALGPGALGPGAPGPAMIETRPIKGTRPATAVGRRELLESAKERAEHIMIVDLERNDLARVAAVGSVDVPELFAVRRWCDLWQAESRITARLAEHTSLAQVLAAVLPGGSVTGAPKLAALAQIAALEPVGRGPAMGALGWVDRRGIELGLTIRTVAADGERLHVWAGGGITWDSDPAAEVAEAAAKAAPVKAALA